MTQQEINKLRSYMKTVAKKIDEKKNIKIFSLKLHVKPEEFDVIKHMADEEMRTITNLLKVIILKHIKKSV
jgi:hypothetical protein